jgi:hypothetical protein
MVIEKTSEVQYSNATGVVVGLSAPVPAQRLLFSQPYKEIDNTCYAIFTRHTKSQASMSETADYTDCGMLAIISYSLRRRCAAHVLQLTMTILMEGHRSTGGAAFEKSLCTDVDLRPVAFVGGKSS